MSKMYSDDDLKFHRTMDRVFGGIWGAVIAGLIILLTHHFFGWF